MDWLDLVREEPELTGVLPGTGVLRAEVVHAVRAEMALSLEDLIHRRTELGRRPLTEAAVEEAGYLMARELGWDVHRTRWEVERAGAGASSGAGPASGNEAG